MILYPATLLKSFISFSSFIVDTLGFFSIESCHLQIAIIILSFLFECLLLFFFQIILARTWTIMLNASDKSGHPCLVPYLRRKALCLSPLNIMLAVGCSYMAFNMLRYVYSIPSLLSVFFFFYHKKILVGTFSSHHLRLSCGFYLHSIHVLYYTDYSYIEPLLHYWEKSHFLWCLILLIWCWIWITYILF